MFRLWGKKWKNNRLLEDTVIEDTSLDTRTHKILSSLDKICDEFNLSVPLWLDSSISDFKRFNKVSFFQDNFIETIDFDYLEIIVIEED